MALRKAVLGMLTLVGLTISLTGCGQNQIGEREALQAQVAQVQQQLVETQAERARWQAMHLESTQSLATIRQEIANLTNRMTAAREQFETQLAQRDAELQQVRAQYETATQQLQAAQETQANWQADIAQREATLSQVKQALAQTQEQFAALQAERTQWQAQQAESTQTLTAMRQELAQLKQALEADRQERQEVVPADQDALRQKIVALKQELSQAAAQQQDAETVQAALRTEVAKRQQELRQVRTELDATRQQLNRQQGRRWESTAQTRQIKEQVSQQLQEAIQDNVVTLQQDAEQLRIRVGGRVLFNPGDTALRPDGQQTLDKIATVLQHYPGYEIQVEGHTDNDPVTNPDLKCWPTNWELSALRAASTVRYLEAQNIAPERLLINGFSHYRPLASNDTERGRAQNRRIEITIHPIQR